MPDLLHMLRIHCTELRLLDLPLELREIVYGMAFEKTPDPKDCDCENCLRTFNCSQVSVVKTEDRTWDKRRIGNPTLLHVSRQLRSEAGNAYYRSE